MFGWLGVLVGILLILLGGWLVLFFPSTTEHQPESFAWTGVVMGIIFLLVGGVLIFF